MGVMGVVTEVTSKLIVVVLHFGVGVGRINERSCQIAVVNSFSGQIHIRVVPIGNKLAHNVHLR